MYNPVVGRKSSAKMRAKAKAEMFAAVGGPVCVHCGLADIRVLQIDHVNGNGRADRARFPKDGIKFYQWVAQAPIGYQILCANCNWIKRWENNEHRKANL